MKEIPLSKGYVAIVDDEDYDYLMQWKWSTTMCRDKPYARRNEWISPKKLRTLHMHRFITQAPAGMCVDHINGDSLDNRRANLRICTNQQNVQSQRPRVRSSRFKGVAWAKKKGRWVAAITKDRKCHFLGHYINEEEAARAYDNAARRFFGEFAKTNFPE